HLDAAEAVLRLGGVEQRRRLLPALASGTLRGGTVKSMDGRRPRATRQRDGFIVSGRELVASPGHHANLFVLLADAEDGLHALLVEAGQRGLELVEPFPTVGRRGGDLWRVELEQCLVSAGHVLGGGRALDARDLASLDGASRMREAAAAVGLAQAPLQAAPRYSPPRPPLRGPISPPPP